MSIFVNLAKGCVVDHAGSSLVRSTTRAFASQFIRFETQTHRQAPTAKQRTDHVDTRTTPTSHRICGEFVDPLIAVSLANPFKLATDWR